MSNSEDAAVSPIEVESPIINSAFYEPRLHWQIEKAEGRRPASYYFRVPEHAGRGRKQARQKELFPGADLGELEELALVNWLRQRVRSWR